MMPQPVHEPWEDAPLTQEEHFEAVRVRRHDALVSRYGSADLGAALAALARVCGSARARAGGGPAWAVVEAWDATTAGWLWKLPNTPDGWAPLVAEVRQARRAAATLARRISAEAEKQERLAAQAEGRPPRQLRPTAKAAGLLRLAISDEAFAHVAVTRWRPRARLAGFVVGTLPDLPEEDEAEEEGRALPVPAPALEPPEERTP